MKHFIRTLLVQFFRIPGVGYLFKALVAAVKAPEIVERHDRLIAELRNELLRQQGAFDSALSALESRLPNRADLEAVSQKASALEYHLPGLLNHISSFNELARNLQRTTTHLSNRIDDMKDAQAAWAQADGRTQRLEEELIALRSATNPVWEQVRELRAALNMFREEEWKHIGSIYQRIEVIREELLFEFRYGPAPKSSNGSRPEPRIVNRQKYSSMSDLRLNLGCGHVPLEGYMNIDLRDLPGVDVVAAIDTLPFTDGTVSEIFSAHVLEHFPQEELRRRLLPYWFGLMKKDGVFRAVTPDWDTMMRKHVSGEYDFEKMRRVTFGGQDYAGDFHFNMFNKNSMTALLEEAGFREICFPVEGRVNGDCYEFEVQALK